MRSFILPPHHLLGRYSSSIVVELTDNANEFVIADAIRIERISDTVPTGEPLSDSSVTSWSSTRANQALLSLLIQSEETRERQTQVSSVTRHLRSLLHPYYQQMQRNPLADSSRTSIWVSRSEHI